MSTPVPPFKNLRFWITLYELTYPIAGIVYFEGVRYFMWHNDEMPRPDGDRPWFTYIAVPITCKEFKDLIRSQIALTDVMDKQPFFRLYMDDVISEYHDETPLKSEHLVDGLNALNELQKPYKGIALYYMRGPSHPDFYK